MSFTSIITNNDIIAVLLCSLLLLCIIYIMYVQGGNIFTGVYGDSYWLEEYLEIIKIDVHFSNDHPFFAFFTPFGYFCSAYRDTSPL